MLTNNFQLRHRPHIDSHISVVSATVCNYKVAENPYFWYVIYKYDEI